MLMLVANREAEIRLMKVTEDGKVVSQQQSNREVGFRNYMRKHFPQINIIQLELPFNGDNAAYDHLFEQYFKEHPHTHHCITVGSKAHLLGEYILRNNRPDIQVMGYDMVDKNAECLRRGSISTFTGELNCSFVCTVTRDLPSRFSLSNNMRHEYHHTQLL